MFGVLAGSFLYSRGGLGCEHILSVLLGVSVVHFGVAFGMLFLQKWSEVEADCGARKWNVVKLFV
jgi:hypothetical protein